MAATTPPPMPPLYPLPPNRVRRNYRGGAMLAAWDGHGPATDGECPEDWIASTVEARNPGLPPRSGEGLSTVATPRGTPTLARLIEQNPVHMLGEAHVQHRGADVGFLTKLLDAGMRLHIQAHPTAAFARQHLGSPYGKLEAYYILAVRDGCEGALTLGFQHDPGPSEWRRIVLEQDTAAMAACFEPVPVRPGECWYVPGGVPHAIGEGLLVVEIMEPSDLVVRCEFEREGLVVPLEARFMGRDPDFALQIFNHESWSVAETRERLCVSPRVVHEAGGVRHEVLFDERHNRCFEVQRLTVELGASHGVDTGGRLAVVLVTGGRGRIMAGQHGWDLAKGQRWLVPAATGSFTIEAHRDAVEVVVCLPQTGAAE